MKIDAFGETYSGTIVRHHTAYWKVPWWVPLLPLNWALMTYLTTGVLVTYQSNLLSKMINIKLVRQADSKWLKNSWGKAEWRKNCMICFSKVFHFTYLSFSSKINITLGVTQILRTALLEIYFKEYFQE